MDKELDKDLQNTYSVDENGKVIINTQKENERVRKLFPIPKECLECAMYYDGFVRNCDSYHMAACIFFREWIVGYNENDGNHIATPYHTKCITADEKTKKRMESLEYKLTTRTITWKLYPKNKPDSGLPYIVTVLKGSHLSGNPWVIGATIDTYDIEEGKWKGYGSDSHTVIAYAELPKPFKPMDRWIGDTPIVCDGNMEYIKFKA